MCFIITFQKSQVFLAIQTLWWENCLQRPKSSSSSSPPLFFSKMLCDLEQVTYHLAPLFLASNMWVRIASSSIHRASHIGPQVLWAASGINHGSTWSQKLLRFKSTTWPKDLPHSVVSVFQTSLHLFHLGEEIETNNHITPRNHPHHTKESSPMPPALSGWETTSHESYIVLYAYIHSISHRDNDTGERLPQQPLQESPLWKTLKSCLRINSTQGISAKGRGPKEHAHPKVDAHSAAC